MNERTIAQYQLLETLGEGGMGIVWLAEDTRLGRRVAIKSVRPASIPDVDARNRLLREARTLARLEHPHVVPLYEVVERGDELHLVMAYMEGGSLRKRVVFPPSLHGDPASGSPDLPEENALETIKLESPKTGISVQDVIRWGIEAADGLAAAHAEGVFHRDIKPDNLFIARDGTLRIGDFGIARHDDHTMTQGISGTLAYMAPEQLRGAPVDARSDLFSLGVTLYELLAGHRPFNGADRSQPPSPIQETRADVSPALSEIVHRLIQTDPANRPASARELADLLQTLPTPSIRRRLPGAGIRRLGATAFIALLAFSGWRIWDRVGNRPETGPGPPDNLVRLAVMPFDFSGAEEFGHYADGIPQLLGYILDGAGNLTTVEERSVRREITDRGLGVVDSESGKPVAARLRADHYVIGSVVEVGGTLQIDASLYNADGSLRTRASKRVTEERKFTEALDALSIELLATLLDHPMDEINRVALATTDSPDALKEYLKGSQLFRTWKFEEAEAHFQASLEADSTLALAHLGLSFIYAWNEEEAAEDHAGAAYDARDRLPYLPRKLIEATHASRSAHQDEAERILRDLLVRYPESLTVRWHLGSLYLQNNPFRGRSIREAVPLYRAISRKDPISPFGWAAVMVESNVDSLEANLAEIYRHYRGEEVRRDEWPANVRSMLAIMRGDWEAERKVWETSGVKPNLHGFGPSNFWLFSSPGRLEDKRRFLLPHLEVRQIPVDETWARLFVAHLDLAQGRTGSARRHFNLVPEAFSNWATALLALAMAQPFMKTDPADLQSLIDELEEWSPRTPPDSLLSGGSISFTRLAGPPWVRAKIKPYLLGLLAAKRGDYDRALEMAAQLQQTDSAGQRAWLSSDLALGIRARVHFEQGRFEQALEELEGLKALRYDADAYSVFLMRGAERWLRARCLEELGRIDEALPWFEYIAEVSEFHEIYVPQATLHRARIHEELGNREGAADLHRTALGYYEGADPEYREYATLAAQRLKTLESPGS